MFGMDMMSGAVKPLADVPEFTSLLTLFSNPILGMLVGTGVTALIPVSYTHLDVYKRQVSGIAHRTFGVNNVGFHLGSQDVTLDFDRLLEEEQIRWLEERANEAVWANHRVEVSYPDEKILQKLEYRSKIDIEDQVRIVTIEDVDVCACCAPHVNNTGEIGLIKVTGWQLSLIHI